MRGRKPNLRFLTPGSNMRVYGISYLPEKFTILNKNEKENTLNSNLDFDLLFL